MIKLAVVADDLTGANDTGVQFAKIGYKTIVVLNVNQNNSSLSENDVIVMDSDSRALSPSYAYQKVKEISRIVREQGACHIYKKVDSTLRGNFGSEIAAVYEEFKPRLTVIAPAFPTNKRVTVGGFQLLDGLPVSLTEIGHDPKTPVSEAWIPNLIAKQASYPVSVVSLQDVLKGREYIRQEIAAHLAVGKDWLVFDAVSRENLRNIVQAAAEFKEVLWVGSAGLAEQLPGVLKWPGSAMPEKTICKAGNVIVVAGSASEVTLGQIAAYREEFNPITIKIDPVAAILQGATEIDRAAANVGTMVAGQQNFLIHCASDKQAVQQAVDAGASIGLGRKEVGEQLAACLGQIASLLVSEHTAGLFLTGGETAVSSCRALQAEGIEITEELMPGIPLGRLIGGKLAGVNIVTKAGAFGDRLAIVRAVKALQGERK